MAGRITVVGLGPGDLSELSARARDALGSADAVFVRTLQHPGAAELAETTDVVTCDDLYDRADTFTEVYQAISERVLTAAEESDVVYAVPGSPLVAERSVRAVRDAARAAGIDVRVEPAPSFLDELFITLEFDPADRGFQLLDGRDLPDPLPLHLPTVIFHVDTTLVLGEVLDRLARVLPETVPLTVVHELGTAHAEISAVPVHEVDLAVAGLRTTLFLDPPAVGYVGAVMAMRRLRQECPWDREQTHDSLVPFAIEEVSELLDALAALPPGAPATTPSDYGAYADVEDELGDVLLQVIFHANLATEVGAFDIEDVAEQLRRKLVRRHPHVFGDVDVDDAAEVVRNWQSIKSEERPGRDSYMDGIPNGMSSLAQAAKTQQRAARVGFDWPDATEALTKVTEEVGEVGVALGTDRVGEEIGDLLFSVVNVARLAGVEPEVALRRATAKFSERFRAMEDEGPLVDLSLAQLNERWERAKDARS